jgi:plasmid stabilization system protein ParE
LTYPTRSLPGFEADVRRAIDHVSREAPERLDAFFAELDATVARLVRHPLVPRVVLGATRSVHCRAGFPYAVLYVVYEENELIHLTALLHDRQDAHGLLPRFL